MNDAIQILIGVLLGVGSSTVFILALFIGFCVLVGFTKTKQTAGGGASVIKSLDETHQPPGDDLPDADRPAWTGRSAAVAGTHRGCRT